MAPPKKPKKKSRRLKSIFGRLTIDESDQGGTLSLEDHEWLSGDFTRDFTELCTFHCVQYIPRVLNRQQPETWLTPSMINLAVFATTASAAVEAKTSIAGASTKHNKSKPILQKTSANSLSQRSVGSEADVHKDAREKSRLLNTVANLSKNRYNYFKPRILVEYQKCGEQKVHEVYVEGWKVDDTMMKVLTSCCEVQEELALLQLRNVSLEPKTVSSLSLALPRFQRIRNLVLDANDLSEADLTPLTDERCQLEHLSLRFCRITDLSAHGMGQALGSCTSWNKKLLTLNLSHNRLSDEGARHLAAGLMTNRTLLVLNLSTNCIGDEGAFALAQVLSDFPLSTEQLQERRKKLSERMQQVVVRITSSSSQNRRNKESGSMSQGSTKTTLKIKKSTTMTDTSSRQKESSSAQTRRKKGAHSTSVVIKTPPSPSSHVDHRQLLSPGVAERLLRNPEDEHPLLEVVTRCEEEQVWIVGNRSLLSLNLSRNHIGERGMCSLRDMLLAQIPRQGQVQISRGLRRLVVHRNAVSQDNAVLRRVQHLSMLKDPLYHVPILSLAKDNFFVTPCAIPPITV